VPRVSVVIPLYNLGRFVGEAIESVLGQTLPVDDVETIVIDDGSTDGGDAVVRRYEPRVRYVRQENHGLPAARNAGLARAGGPFVTFLDADDRFLPEMLATQLGVFAARPEVGIVYTGFRFIDAAGRSLGTNGWSREEGDVLSRLVLGNMIHPHLALVRREAAERVGGFDERLGGAADWDFWLRLSRAGVRWACVDRALAEYRLRADAMHRDTDAMLRDSLRVLDKAFADPALPDPVRALRPLAYQRALLDAACAHYRAGNWAGGMACLRRAAEARPAFLAEPESIRLFCRWLLPPERQRGVTVVANRRRLVGIVRRALDELFAEPGIGLDVRRRRWVAWLAVQRASARFALKRLAWLAGP